MLEAPSGPLGSSGCSLMTLRVGVERLLISTQPAERRRILRPHVGHRRIVVEDLAEQARALFEPALADALDRLPVRRAGAAPCPSDPPVPHHVRRRIGEDDCVPT